MKISDCTILLVDDEEDIIIQCKKILEPMGAYVVSAPSVLSALKMLDKVKPHLIITDIWMKPLTGFDFLNEARKSKVFSEIPMVILSSADDRQSIQKAIRLGADDYILKPLRAANLIKRIRKALRGQDCLSYDFPADQRPMTSLSVGAQIQSIGDISFRVESNVCFNVCHNLSIKANREKTASMSNLTFSIHDKGRSHLKGMYLSELIAVPSGPDFLNLRKELKA